MANEARLLRVLALLESDNDAEALQALRTAQRLLSQTGRSLSGLAAAEGKPSQMDVSGQRRSNRIADDREILVLRAELQRFRALYDQACREKADSEREIERLKNFLKPNQSLPLFQRLRDREENVRALTREVGRLRDELFIQERRTRDLERQLASSGSRSRGASRRGPNPGPQATGSASSEADGSVLEAVKLWVQRAGIVLSSEETDWVSVRHLHRLFQKPNLQMRDGRVLEVWSGGLRPPRLTQTRFSAALQQILGSWRAGQGEPGARSGFCIVSNLDLGASGERSNGRGCSDEIDRATREEKRRAG